MGVLLSKHSVFTSDLVNDVYVPHHGVLGLPKVTAVYFSFNSYYFLTDILVSSQ